MVFSRKQKYLVTNKEKCRVTAAKISARNTLEEIQVVFQRLIESKINEINTNIKHHTFNRRPPLHSALSFESLSFSY